MIVSAAMSARELQNACSWTPKDSIQSATLDCGTASRRG